MKLREYNRWFVPIFGFCSALNTPLLALIQAMSAFGGFLPPGVDVLSLVWTVLAAACVAVLLFDVPTPPAWRMAAALALAVVVGICGVLAVLDTDQGLWGGLSISFVMSGLGLATIAVGMAGTVLHPESVRERRPA